MFSDGFSADRIQWLAELLWQIFYRQKFGDKLG